MPEYIRITPDYDPDDENVLRLITNLTLTTENETEIYASPEAGEQGSPLAQLVFGLGGIAALSITPESLVITREPEIEWYILIDEVSAALKDFYL